MNEIPVFLTLDNVLAIHNRMISEFGGETGIRDMGLLEAAVMMPMASFDNRFLHETVPSMASAYLFHICLNHAFLDGNKRTALASAEIFSNLNGFELEASDGELEKLTLGIIEKRFSKAEVKSFFENRLRPQP